MILTCNSCEKKFIVPDNAIGKNGRLVQCSSCGNKWKQFPIKEKKEPSPPKKAVNLKTKKVSKKIKRKTKKSGPDLYSPEYLAKKHGIQISQTSEETKEKSKKSQKINFGFYNFLLVLTIFIIFILRLLYFTQDFLIYYIPFADIYISYIFESLRNLKDIFLNLF